MTTDSLGAVCHTVFVLPKARTCKVKPVKSIVSEDLLYLQKEDTYVAVTDFSGTRN